MSTIFQQNHQQPLSGNETRFVHLQMHSLYSPLESTVRIPDALAKCKEYNMPAMALTDHGNMCGAVDFYLSAKKTGIKPIFGCEIYTPISSESGGSGQTMQDRQTARILLLAMNQEGYKNLAKLISRGYLEGRSGDRAVVTMDWIKELAEHWIAIPSGLKSEVGWLLNRGKEDAARESLFKLKEIFSDRLYIGQQACRLAEVQEVNRWLLAEGRTQGIKPVALCNVHYLNREDASSHEVLACIKLGRTIQDTGRRVHCDDFWFKDTATLTEEFADLPEALTNTLEIADRCNVQFKFTNAQGNPIYYLPTYQVPEVGKSIEDFLYEESLRGLEWRFQQEAFRATKEKPGWKPEDYYTRLKDEVRMIQSTGFAGYFLIVSDFIRWAKEKGIPVGPGRGSGAGSIVAWALRITDIDPIPYNLLFERFINPERISMPDFDVDFCQNRREEVIEYVKQKYGKEKVCQIITFGRLQTKNCIRDVGRVLGMAYGEVDQIAKIVPDRLGIKVQEALDAEPRLQELVENNPLIATLFKHALKLEGLIRNFGKHAGGVIITDKPMTEYTPLYADDEGNVMTQFDKDASEKIGLVKFDFLGLKTLTHIQLAEDFINETPREKKFHIEDIPIDEKEPFQLISKGDTIGVFQVESSGMIDLCKRIRPINLDELTAINALYRPGPLESGMVDDFIERKHGRIAIEYPAQQLEEVLKETFGVIVYQEQVMRAARVLAGYTLGEADLLRRAMGKKKVDEMNAQKERFIAGAAKQNISAEKAATIFDLIEKFAGYGFNKSHATAYAFISYQTAYLKYHYPAQFYAALLTMELSDTDKLAKYIADAKEHQIPVLGPDINESDRYFQVVKKENKESIRFGLEAIKNVGSAAVDVIRAERIKNGPFRSMGDFCSRVSLRKVNKKTLEALVRTGAFDSLYKSINRNALFLSLESMMAWGAKEFEQREIGQGGLFTGLFFDQDAPDLSAAEPEIPKAKDWSHLEKLEMERELLGFYVSGHPLDPYASLLKSIRTFDIGEVQRRAQEGQFVVNPEERWKKTNKSEPKLVGLLTYFREIMTKKGARMAFATLEDFSGKIELVCFPKTYEQYGTLLKVGSVLMVTGNLEASERVAKLLISSVQSLETVQMGLAEKAQLIAFRLDVENTSKEQLEKLHATFLRFKGTCRGVIEYSMGDVVKARMQLPDTLRFLPNYEFVSEVRDIFGKDVLVFH